MASRRSRALALAAVALALATALASASVAIAQGAQATTDESATTETTDGTETTETSDTTETTETTDATAERRARAAYVKRLKKLKRQSFRFKRKAIRLHRVMGKPRPRIHNRPALETRLERRVWLRKAWKKRAVKARTQFRRPPHKRAWRCIHRYEGPWRDPGAPYYGGLQMDLTFQRMYAPKALRRKGTANRWRPLEQMWVAERALRAGRGFYPWPVAARRCGLI